MNFRYIEECKRYINYKVYQRKTNDRHFSIDTEKRKFKINVLLHLLR